MRTLLLKKLVQAGAGIILLVLLSFFISRSLHGDPVKRLVSGGSDLYVSTDESRINTYNKLYRQLGFELPLFYFTLSGAAVPDSFLRLPDQRFRELVIRTSYWSSNPDSAYAWCKLYCATVNREFDFSVPDNFISKKNEVMLENNLSQSISKLLFERWAFLQSESQHRKFGKWMPVLHFSMENQFHYWLFGNGNADYKIGTNNEGLIHGNLGTSWLRGAAVINELKFPFLLTFLLTGLVLLLSFPLSLLLGICLAKYRNSAGIHFVNSFLVLLYALPAFWIGSLLLFFFSNPNWLNIFPSSSPVLDVNGGVRQWLYSVLNQWKYFIIPMFVLSYSTIVYLSQMTYELLYEELQKPYVLTQRAKGSSENAILYCFALKNVLVPVCVGLMSVFPILIGGTVIIDYLFSLPGLGAVLARSCEQRDFPVIGGILLLTGCTTVFSFLLTELMILKIDPRLSENV